MEDFDTALPPEAEARLAALQATQRANRAREAEDRAARRAMWRTHHWPDEHHRCAVVAGRKVCRRCLTLYPVALVVMAASFAGFVPWPARFDTLAIWALCLPATVEFLAEKLGGVAYSSRRQIAVTALVGLALGRGLWYELDDRWSWLFWGPVLVFGGVWFLAALVAYQRQLFRTALAASVEFGPGPGAGARVR